ncbi:hypothetical protein ACOMHN_055317 [Nucella lapillus]
MGKTLGWRFFARYPGLCRAVGSLCTVSCVGSLMTLSTVSLNRYILITHQHLYRRLFTLPSTIVLCASFYVLGLCFVLVNFVGVGNHSFDHRSLECIWDRMANHHYTRFFSIAVVMLPIVVTGLCYARLYLRVKKSRMKIHHHSNNGNPGMDPSSITGMRSGYSRQRNDKESKSALCRNALIPRGGGESSSVQAEGEKSENYRMTLGVNPASNLGGGESPETDNLSGNGMDLSPTSRSGGVRGGSREEKGSGSSQRSTMKLARTLFIIYVVFSACWLPFAVLLLVEDGEVTSQSLHLIIVAWAHLHPSLNCLVYYNTHSKFRGAFRKLLHLDTCCR